MPLQKFTSQQWLEEIENRYFDERDDLVRQSFQAALHDNQEPYSFILHVMLKAFFDLYSKRIPITFYALDELEIWLELKHQNGEVVPTPLEAHKRQAMEFLCRSGYNYLDKVNKLFQLDQGDNSYLTEYIHLDADINPKKLKQFVVIMYTIKLRHNFSARDVMLPLLATDQIQVLETYVGEDKKLQFDYAGFLDSLCAMKEDTVAEMVSQCGLSVKDPSKLLHKTITKMAEKVVKKYELNPDDFPAVFEAKNIGALCYLVRQKCKEERNSSNESHCDKWNDLIEAAVRGKPRLQVKLVEKLADCGNMSEATKYAKKYYICPRNLPQDVYDELQDYVRNYTEISSIEIEKTFTEEKESEDWEGELDEDAVEYSLGSGYAKKDELDNQYYKLKLPKEKIKLVETIKQLQILSTVLFSSAKIIGFDAEWKPTMCRAGEQDRVSILQLAVSEQVYIVDLFKLYVTPNAEDSLKEFFNLLHVQIHHQNRLWYCR